MIDAYREYPKISLYEYVLICINALLYKILIGKIALSNKFLSLVRKHKGVQVHTFLCIPPSHGTHDYMHLYQPKFSCVARRS